MRGFQVKQEEVTKLCYMTTYLTVSQTISNIRITLLENTMRVKFLRLSEKFDVIEMCVVDVVRRSRHRAARI